VTLARFLAMTAVLGAAGVVLLVAGRGTVADVAGLAILGIVAVAVTSAAFYAVGRSEDRARER
jgi:preprotein translocase subunit SecF